MWRRKPRGGREATEARIRAEHALAETRADTVKHQALAERLRELRQHNNFAAAIETSFRGGRL
jgi:hypothetical protein